MTTHEIALRERELNAMLSETRFLDAFDRFYHDDVVMQENTQPAVEGKNANRQREQEFFGNVDEVEEATLLGSAIDGDTSFSEWALRFRFKDGTRFGVTQVAARRWRDGKVVNERFYYAA